MQNQIKELPTAKELVETIQVSMMGIYWYINAKKLTAYKIDKEFRIDETEFASFLKESKIK
jgi:hypothetical protein